MKKERTIRAKIVHHSEGLGAPYPELIRKRAKEIAAIDGRTDVTDEDWRQAKLELHGGHSIHLSDGDDEMVGAGTEREIPGSLGHHTERLMPEDTENMAGELIAEGMDEAVHEQMLEASRRSSEEEEEESV